MGRAAIHLKVDAGLATLEIDNPHKGNCLTAQMLEDLEKHCQALESRNDLKAVFVTGRGQRAFCCGADKNRVFC